MDPNNGVAPADDPEAGSGEGGDPGEGKDPADGGKDLADWAKDLPEQFRADTPEDALGKAVEAWKGARDKMREGVPATADEYGDLQLSDAAKAAYGEIPADDPVMKLARERALDAGISKAAFQAFLPSLMDGLVESGLAPDTLNPDTEIEALGGDEKASQRRETLNGWLEGLKGQKKLEDGQIREAQLIMATADGVKLIEALRGLASESTIDPAPGSGAGKVTEESIKEMRQDSRYRTDSSQYDPAYRKEVDDLAAQFYK
jgi:hypothetical protein